MSSNPPSLRALGSYWVSQGGVNLGVVGNRRTHRRGYHLGWLAVVIAGISMLVAMGSVFLYSTVMP